MIDDKELNSWSAYHGARVPRDRLSGSPVGNLALRSPPMTNAERLLAGANAPKSDEGTLIFANYNFHIGRNYSSFLGPACFIAIMTSWLHRRRSHLPDDTVSKIII